MQKRGAVWAYNHSDAYVDTVLGLARRISEPAPPPVKKGAKQKAKGKKKAAPAKKGKSAAKPAAKANVKATAKSPPH